MFLNLKYGKLREKQGKSKVGLTSETEGVIRAIIYGILFGAMPLMAKLDEYDLDILQHLQLLRLLHKKNKRPSQISEDLDNQLCLQVLMPSLL